MRQLASHTVKHLTSARQISSRPRRTLCTRQLSASRSKLRMCVSSARNTLQHLYEQALSTFNSRQQPQDLRQLEAVQTALQGVSLQELGLQPSNRAGAKQRSGLFGGWASPAKSRVLYGDLHVKSYDWNDSQSGATSSTAKLVLDEVIDASSGPAAIFPASGGNIHQFTAMSDCAVLDILAPPYSPHGGRDCTYYHVEQTNEAGVADLRVRNPTPYLAMKNLRYKGVAIQPLAPAHS